MAIAWLALLGLPLTASAQREQFFDAMRPFYSALSGVYGDEGPQLTASLETLSTALIRWDLSLGATERELRTRLKGGDALTALEVHLTLAAIYAERSRFPEALREIEEDIRLDPTRAVFHRFKALLHEADMKPGEAARAFRAAWMVDSEDPRHAYKLVALPSDQTTPAETERALNTLASIEREIVRGQRAQRESPFLTLNSINDEAGDGLAFVPAAYAPPISLLLAGQFDAGMSLLRGVVAADPLVADPISHSGPMARGIVELREGRVVAAIESLATAVARAPHSSEARRILATAYGINGDGANSVWNLREAVRLNPRDERSWLALARSLDTAGQLSEAVDVLRTGAAELPDSGALRWLLSVTSAKRQRTDTDDVELVALVERLVLLTGRGDLHGHIARLAHGLLDYDRALQLLEMRVALTPNSPDAHKALGRAYVEHGRENAGYAELVIALLLDTSDAETLTAIGQLHLSAGRFPAAVEIMTRAIALEPTRPEAVHALGDALVRAGRSAEGQMYLEASERLQAQAIEQQRRRRTAGMLSLQAEVRISQRAYDAAADLWQQVIDLDSSNPMHYLRLADALAGAKRLEEAVAQLQLAISRDAGPEAHRRLVDIYVALGRPDESARERTAYVKVRLQQLRGLSVQPADPGN